MSKCILVRGCPGSGKSTFANYAFPGILHLENDMFHMKNLEYHFDGKTQKTAIEWCMSSAEIALKNGFDVVIANTFTKTQYVSGYQKLAALYNADFIVYRMRSKFENAHGLSNIMVENFEQSMKDWTNEINVYANLTFDPSDKTQTKYTFTKLNVGNKVRNKSNSKIGTISRIICATYGFLNCYIDYSNGTSDICYPNDIELIV